MGKKLTERRRGDAATYILQEVLRQADPGVPQEAILHDACAMAISTWTQFQGVCQHVVQGIHCLRSTGNLDKYTQSHLNRERRESQDLTDTPLQKLLWPRKYSVSNPFLYLSLTPDHSSAAVLPPFYRHIFI